MTSYNNTVSNGSIGMRFVGMNESDLLSCINAISDPPQFPDEQDPLRRIWWNNRNLTGYVYWLAFGDIYQDYFQETIVCNDGCPDLLLTCNVSQLYSPLHPYFGRYIFTTSSEAIEHCALP